MIETVLMLIRAARMQGGKVVEIEIPPMWFYELAHHLGESSIPRMVTISGVPIFASQNDSISIKLQNSKQTEPL